MRERDVKKKVNEYSVNQIYFAEFIKPDITYMYFVNLRNCEKVMLTNFLYQFPNSKEIHSVELQIK